MTGSDDVLVAKNALRLDDRVDLAPHLELQLRGSR